MPSEPPVRNVAVPAGLMLHESAILDTCVIHEGGSRRPKEFNEVDGIIWSNKIVVVVT